MPYVAANDLEMYYEEDGSDDAPPMVLLHNFTSTGARAWRHHREELAGSYRLYIPDWRGHGRTSNPGGLHAMNHRQYANDVIAFCRQLDIQHPVFVGLSSGAMQLLSLAVAAPGLASALVLAACTTHFPEALRRLWRDATPTTFFPEPYNNLLQDLHTLYADHWKDVVAAFLDNASHSDGDDFPALSELSVIDVPVLLLHGDRDRYFPVEIPSRLYGALPDAELAVLPNTGHLVTEERPQWVADIVRDFLARRVP